MVITAAAYTSRTCSSAVKPAKAPCSAPQSSKTMTTKTRKRLEARVGRPQSRGTYMSSMTIKSERTSNTVAVDKFPQRLQAIRTAARLHLTYPRANRASHSWASTRQLPPAASQPRSVIRPTSMATCIGRTAPINLKACCRRLTVIARARSVKTQRSR